MLFDCSVLFDERILKDEGIIMLRSNHQSSACRDGEQSSVCRVQLHNIQFEEGIVIGLTVSVINQGMMVVMC